MPTESREASPPRSLQCHWPQRFRERRPVNDGYFQSENRPYVDFVQSNGFDGEEDEGDMPDEDQDRSDDDDDDNEEEEEEEDDDEEAVEVDQDDKVSSGKSIVRIFMEGMTGDEEALLYPDQVEQVVSFYEHQDFGELETKTGQARKFVALLDDRNICGAVHTNCGRSPCPGHSRPHLGPLTSERLSKELERKRFKLESDRAVATYASESLDCDAERRTMYIIVLGFNECGFADLSRFVAGLDPPTIEALTRTAALFQALALKDLLYKHLTGKTSIGVTITPQGYRTFTLECHIPYFALRKSKVLLGDNRTKLGGKPLRESWKLPSLSSQLNPPASMVEVPCLYEAQMSIVVTGTSHWVWVAYGFVDAYFESKDIVASYNQLNGTKGRWKGRADPLLAGWLDADLPIWMPREYFFKVLEVRMKQVLREWNGVFLRVDAEVKQSRENPIFLLPRSSLKSEQVREFSAWNIQMVNILRNLISRLSDTVGAWNEFRRSEIGYFQDDTEPPTSLSQLKSSIAAVNKAVSNLNALLQKFEDLEKKLCNDNPQGLNAHLNLENHEAAMSQLRTGRHVHVLTVVTVLFLPLTLNASLFSATGVLPFAPNFGRFVLVLIPLTVLVGTTAIVLFRWRSCLPVMIQCLDWVRNLMISFEKKRSEGETSDDANTLPKSRKWSSLFTKAKKVDDHGLRDLERQEETQRDGESHQA